MLYDCPFQSLSGYWGSTLCLDHTGSRVYIRFSGREEREFEIAAVCASRCCFFRGFRFAFERLISSCILISWSFLSIESRCSFVLLFYYYFFICLFIFTKKKERYFEIAAGCASGCCFIFVFGCRLAFERLIRFCILIYWPFVSTVFLEVPITAAALPEVDVVFYLIF